MEEEAERKRPSIIAKFDRHDDTFSEPFTTNGPWQISWEGDLDIEVWMQNLGATPMQCGHAGGSNKGTPFSLSRPHFSSSFGYCSLVIGL
jgi:hypothetical protein